MTVFRLVLSDLRSNTGIWVGALVVTIATAAAAAVAAAMLETGLALVAAGSERDLLRAAGLATVATLVVVLTVVAVAAVLGSVTRLTIDLQRRGYALWQLVGVPSRSVTVIVRLQLAVVALVGSSVGCLVVAPVVPAVLHVGLSASDGLRDLHERFGVVSGVAVVVSVTAVVVLSSLRSSRRAGRVRPVEVLRDPEDAQRGTGWGRWAGAGVAVALAALMTSTLAAAGVRAGAQVVLIGPLVTAALVAVGPTLFPAVVRTWTRIVPAHRSASWFLARNAAASAVGRSTATVSALVITIALPGSITAGFATLGDAIGRSTGATLTGLAPQSFLLMLGGPLLVSLSGAAATVLMAGRTREQEAALVEAAGGSRGVVVARAAWESVILVGTAVLVSAVVLVVTSCGQAIALGVSVPGTVPHLGLAAAGPAALVSLVLMVAAGTLPLVVGRRRSIPLVLAAD
ncbi:FtsX-like permease family protein [Curtobacterium sp. MCBD17_032]|uniref:FtsX-like permease family protein n=1 Tax=Curtobacterium sp. MCBD17_032 TaxID=2175659 RepID=UPI000DA86810|nr:FtsX-like permease family protein [Curtobacterium sp. MCBD17_032]PZE84135.1 hypothetical protein DEI91_09575 [Curtobacterium sp. MCBD17_032]